MPTFDQIRIPFPNRQQVYDEYVADFKAREGERLRVVAYGTFVRLWRENPALRKVIPTPRNSGFPECTECGNFRRKLEEPGLPPAKREAIKKARMEHHNLQRGERATYAKHREMSHREPLKYGCAIIDGMDLSKSTTPHFKRETKATEGIGMNTRMVHRLLGVKLHQNGVTRHFGYVIPPWVQGGSANAVCEVVMRLIEEMGELRPAHFFLQVDNCSENKCKVLLALASKLVKDNVFESFQINTLMVGHTHEDIDQWFSTFSKALDTKDIWTVQDMLQLLATMSANDAINPKVILGTTRHDFKAWLLHTIDPELGYYGNRIAPHEFLFSWVDGDVLMRYKAWSCTAVYSPLETKGIKVMVRAAALPFPKFDAFCFKWDEDEKCLNAVLAVLDAASARPEIVLAWKEYWRNIPKSVDDVEAKWDIAVVKPRPAVEAQASGPDVPIPAMEFYESQVLVSHAGLPRQARNRLISNITNDERLRQEAAHAKNLVPLKKMRSSRLWWVLTSGSTKDLLTRSGN